MKQLKQRFKIIALCTIAASGVALLDYMVPLGLGVVVLYVAVVVLSFSADDRRTIWYTAGVCTALTLIGLWYSPASSIPLSAVLTNRGLFIALMWVVALLGMHLDVAKHRLQEQEDLLERANRELERLARNDVLTGLANRRHFDEHLLIECQRASRGGSPLALLMIDIDFFKQYNDSGGHQAGDACLTEIAGAIQESLRRPGDLAARYGGEEFSVILPLVDIDGAVELAKGIQENVARLAIPHPGSPNGKFVTVSIGAAVVRAERHTIDPAALVKAADDALYRAKEEGRNRICRAI